jgi:UDP-N-acetylglucosamine--N-acetylmuramyl-(pentapeptide) pyrophosphoryl-undecaprenol N-acetylglucosamine transferase
MQQQRTVLIACGGTGGHLAPGIALAERLEEAGSHCVLVVSQKKVDARLLEAHPKMEFLTIAGAGFSAGLSGFFKAAKGAFRGFWQANSFILNYKPSIVIGFGGFTTFCLAIVAILHRIPLVLHEANHVPGKVTRWLGRYAHVTYVPEGASSLIKKNSIGGYPIRSKVNKIDKNTARAAFDIPAHGPLVVVLGGSQGAAALTEWSRAYVERICKQGAHLVAVCGLQDTKTPDKKEYCGADGQAYSATFISFCDDMGALLSAADIAVSRSGAGFLAECARCEVSAILIPFPFAADDHQKANALHFCKQGGGVMMDQSEIETRLWRDLHQMLRQDRSSHIEALKMLDSKNTDCVNRMTQAIVALLQKS